MLRCLMQCGLSAAMGLGENTPIYGIFDTKIEQVML